MDKFRPICTPNRQIREETMSIFHRMPGMIAFFLITVDG